MNDYPDDATARLLSEAHADRLLCGRTRHEGGFELYVSDDLAESDHQIVAAAIKLRSENLHLGASELPQAPQQLSNEDMFHDPLAEHRVVRVGSDEPRNLLEISSQESRRPGWRR